MCTVKVLPALERRTSSAPATLPLPLEIRISGQGGERLFFSLFVGQRVTGKYCIGSNGRETLLISQRRPMDSARPRHWFSAPATPSVKHQQVTLSIFWFHALRETEPLQQGRPLMPAGFAIGIFLFGDPIHLNHLTLAFEREMAMEGMVATSKNQ